MKVIASLIILAIGVGAISIQTAVDSTIANPAILVSSCQLDLNGDEMTDIAELIESDRGRELVILIRSDSSFTAFTFPDTLSTEFQLSCAQGATIQGYTDAGQEVERTTAGAYLILYQPESAAFAYFWNGLTFEQVWISD